MSIGSLVNVPRADNKNAEVVVRVDGNMIHVLCADKNKDHPWNTTTIASMFVGDHMFEPDKRDHLRRMIGESIVSAITQARDRGYAFAQSDIRRAIGCQK